MAKRLKAAERRASILAVAKVLFADRGFHGVSVDEIAKRVGVCPAVLYQHFASKEALYEAVLNDIACKREHYVDAALSGPSDFGSVLYRMARVYVESVARDPDYLRMELRSVLEDASTAKQFFENRWKSFADYIEYSVRELTQEGQVRHVNPKPASLLFQGMIREALYSKCIYQSDHYREFELQALVRQLVELFLQAIGFQHQENENG